MIGSWGGERTVSISSGGRERELLVELGGGEVVISWVDDASRGSRIVDSVVGVVLMVLVSLLLRVVVVGILTSSLTGVAG